MASFCKSLFIILFTTPKLVKIWVNRIYKKLMQTLQPQGNSWLTAFSQFPADLFLRLKQVKLTCLNHPGIYWLFSHPNS